MAYKITDKCISCGACADVCPVQAISEGESIYVIDQETLMDAKKHPEKYFFSGCPIVT